jgi:predicted PurR-regulated permease PerM
MVVSESMPPSVRVTASFRGLFALAALVVVIAGLREAADILVPVAFAAFITVLLSPAVRRLRRWGVPVAIAIPLVVLALLALLALVVNRNYLVADLASVHSLCSFPSSFGAGFGALPECC